MKSLKYYYARAKKEKWAIGQFNFSTFEQLRAIIYTAQKLKSPLILGTSEGEISYFGIEEAVSLKKIISSRYKVPVFLNLDHGKNFNLIKKAIDFGYDSIHYDGSFLPLKENIKNTKKVISLARRKGIIVEGEVGIIRGSSEELKERFIEKGENTSIVDAKKFFKETRVDLLAVSIGNVHGVYKNMPDLDFNLLESIKKETNANLVLHGASGIKNNDLKKAINRGVVKININTEIRSIWRDSLKEEILKGEMKPYNIYPIVEENISKIVEKKINTLGSNQKM